MEDPCEHGVVLITGGAQGIGKGIARLLLESGMQVAIADRDVDACEEMKAEYGDNGRLAVFDRCR